MTSDQSRPDAPGMTPTTPSRASGSDVMRRSEPDANEAHWLSPNGVDHLLVRGHCVTCGKPHPVEATR